MKKLHTRAAAIAATAGLVLSVSSAAFAATVSAPTAKTLVAMTAEEKLAHDIYVTLGSYWNARKFSNISNSETRHYTEMQTLLKTYGIADTTANDPVGKFDDPEVQKLYNALVAEGKTSLTAAYGVGVKVEQLDIADIDKILAKWMPADVKLVLQNLRTGSQNHLAAFSR